MSQSFHVAFNEAVVFESHPVSRITCIACWGKYLVVGTEKGHLLIYDFIPERTGFKPEIKASFPEFSKKPIEQLTIHEGQNLMIMLSDGLINVHSLPSFKLLTSLAKFKGAISYTPDSTGGNLKLAIVHKKKIIICDFNGTDFVLKKELSVPDVVKLCLWCGNSLCIGIKKEYDRIDIENGSMKELFRSELPQLAGCNVPSFDNNMLLCSKHQLQNISVFIGLDGKPTKEYGLLWSDPPIALGCIYPYAIALLPKAVEIYLLFGSLAQQINIPGATCMAFSSDGVVYVASTSKNSSIWRLSQVDFSEQLDHLIKSGKLNDALLLIENLDESHIPGKAKKIENIKLNIAYQSFNLGNYGRSVREFLSLNVDPLQVIPLFGNFLPLCLRAQYKFPVKIEELNGNSLGWAYQALMSFLEKKRKELATTDAQKRPDDDSANVGYSQEDVPQGYDPLEWNATTDPRQIIDTTLLRCYDKLNSKANITNLVTLPNHCHTKECENILLQSKRYADLVFLYQSRGLHGQALALLQKLGKDPQSELPGTKFSIEYLKVLGKDFLNILLDPERTLWILQDNKQKGLEIFTATRKPGQELPPDRVLAFLEEYALEKKAQTISKILVTAYLEFIITELGEKNSDFHHKLAVHYFEIVMDLKRKNQDANVNKMVAGTEPGQLGYMRDKLLNFLEDSNYYMPAKLLSRYDYAGEGLREERAILLSKVGKHLDALREYIHELHDFKIAEEYCRKHYDADQEEFRDVYLNLLEVYLAPNPPNATEHFAKQLDQAAFKLLNEHYKEIDIAKALNLIPPNTPLSKLYFYFENVICDINKDRRTKQIQMNLQAAERMKTQSELLNLRSNIVKITDDQYCTVCNEKINLMIFSRFPDGTLKHYKCFHKEKYPGK